MTIRTLPLSLLFGSICLLGTGCTIIADVDRSDIPTGGAAATGDAAANGGAPGESPDAETVSATPATVTTEDSAASR